MKPATTLGRNHGEPNHMGFRAAVDALSRRKTRWLRNLTADVRTIRDALREIKAGGNPGLQFESARLKEALTVLNTDNWAGGRGLLATRRLLATGPIATPKW